MLEPQVVVNLLPKLGVSADLVRHGDVKGFKDAAGVFLQRREHAPTTKSARWKGPYATGCGVRGARPTRSLCGAGVAATRLAVRFG
jgi:hypothetical protein